jgi:hypothetical protein
MIFIGGWGMKFIFFRIFSIFLPQTVKNDQICIQTVKFIFKQLNLNLNGPIRRRHLSLPPSGGRYRLGSNARPGSNTGGTARSGQAT